MRRKVKDKNFVNKNYDKMNEVKYFDFKISNMLNKMTNRFNKHTEMIMPSVGKRLIIFLTKSCKQSRKTILDSI